MKKEGYSNWIFPLIESPFKAFVEHWSKEKDKAKSKGVINSLTGQLKYTNYFSKYQGGRHFLNYNVKMC